MEQKEMEENEASEIRRSSVHVDTNFDAKFSDLGQSNVVSFRKKVILVSDWKNLTFCQKFLRNFIIFFPIIFIIGINMATQLIVAYYFNQKNFNLLNIAGNLFVVYLLMFHFTVFMPLMFLRGKVLLDGDYLWSPACNFIVKNSPKVDKEGLKKATEDYDEKYLTLLAHGYDPIEYHSNFNIEDGKMFWKKSKLADFAKKKDPDFPSDSDDDDKYMNPNRGLSKSKSFSPFTVKYSTFENQKQEFNVDDHMSDIKSRKSDFSNNSKWSEQTEGLNVTQENISKNLNIETMAGNDFSEDEDFSDNIKISNEKNSSGEDFHKISSNSKDEKSKSDLDFDSSGPISKEDLDNDLDDYFTDIDKNVKDKKNLDEKDSNLPSPVLSEKEDDYFNVKTEKEIDTKK